MHVRVQSLADLPIGQKTVVQRVGGNRSIVRRLMEMGLLPGTVVETVRKAPLGDPLEVRARGFSLSLRRAEAAHIALGEGTSEDRGDGTTPKPVPPPGHRSRATHARTRSILVAGNPNSGKTTIFNALTGARARVGNYPGVTVTRLAKKIDLPDGSKVELVDLPGTYSLSARSLEEEVAVDAVLGRRGAAPDAVLVVVDSSAIERGLYLVLQIVETGVPVVVALNMTDEAKAAGSIYDPERLGRWLGATVIPTVASRQIGIDRLLEALVEATSQPHAEECPWDGLTLRTLRDVSVVEDAIDASAVAKTAAARRALALWALLSLEDGDGAGSQLSGSVTRAVSQVRRQAAGDGRDLDLEIVGARYRWIEAAVQDARRDHAGTAPKWTHRIDGVLTHRVYGLATFAIVMAVLFEALFSWSEPLIGGIETATAWLQAATASIVPDGVLQDLLLDGVIAGVGNVIVFIPQIAMLFFFIAVLEDVGYLARVAFVIDRVMGRVGLHGKAFVPMLSGFACAIPAVLATRTIEHRRDRLITMLTLPLMSCSARLPVYVLVTAVVFAGSDRLFGLLTVGAVVLFAMYSLSVVAALGAAAVLRRTVLRGPRLPLLLELPPYRIPGWRNVLVVTWQRVRKFLVDAGTIILSMTIILWALLSFPRDANVTDRYDGLRADASVSIVDQAERAARLAELEGLEAAEQISQSIGGRLGHVLEPLVEPLGFDWRIGVGILGAFAAREVFVSTLGIVFGIQEADEESSTLRASLRAARRPDGSSLMTPLTGISLMVFFVLACQCMSTVVVVRKESGSWGWPLFMFAYMSVLAYSASLCVYQVGSLLGWGVA